MDQNANKKVTSDLGRFAVRSLEQGPVPIAPTSASLVAPVAPDASPADPAVPAPVISPQPVGFDAAAPRSQSQMEAMNPLLASMSAQLSPQTVPVQLDSGALASTSLSQRVRAMARH